MRGKGSVGGTNTHVVSVGPCSHNFLGVASRRTTQTANVLGRYVPPFESKKTAWEYDGDVVFTAGELFVFVFSCSVPVASLLALFGTRME